MGKGIPKVREWMITMHSGDRFKVLAPTRKLAILNLRFESFRRDIGANGWGPIKSVGAIRNQTGTHVSVERIA